MKKQKPFLALTVSLLLSLTLFAQPQQGQTARELSLPTVQGDTIHLSSLKGKVVLLDFWASWCGPCRISNKSLVKLYSKYKGKGFEILGVSLDDQKNKWKSAIKQDKITWLQVNDDGGWEAKTVAQWGINAIPTSYLIDKDGKLLAMDLEGEELEKALKYLLDK
jgi:peroxiredoxin